MSSEKPSSQTVERRQWDDDLTHSWCCDERVAWCGADMSDMDEVDEQGDCPLCALSESDPCPYGCNVDILGLAVGQEGQ